MIVCSCNVFSDQQVRSTLAEATQQLRMSQIYDGAAAISAAASGAMMNFLLMT